jgi:hypothetical protein
VANALQDDNWMTDTLYNISAPLIAEFIMLWVEVDAIQFDASDQQSNTIICTHSTNGKYSATSAYRMQFEGSLASIFVAKIWKV